MTNLSKLALVASTAAVLGLAAPAMADGGKGTRSHDRDDNFSISVTISDHDRRGYRDYRGYRHHGYHYGGHKARHRILDRRDVRYSLRRAGYREIRGIDYMPRRGVYVAFAEGYRGRDVRLVVDAYSGRILDVDRLGRGHYGKRGHRGGYHY